MQQWLQPNTCLLHLACCRIGCDTIIMHMYHCAHKCVCLCVRVRVCVCVCVRLFVRKL